MRTLSEMAAQQLSMLEDDPQLPAGKLKASSISLSKTINAPTQEVYDQWLIPVFVGDWMFGRHSIVKLENKVRKGGEFAYVVKSGNQEISYRGTYELLDIPHILIFSWVENVHPKAVSRVVVKFQEEHGKTRIRLTIKLDPKLHTLKETIKE
ncbi:MAG: SRPBCC domain-containing protein, partial [Proteobacteria bacterium]|nr:SRPBCC domain-containing protein [Pseudomonadota bacterium]